MNCSGIWQVGIQIKALGFSGYVFVDISGRDGIYTADIRFPEQLQRFKLFFLNIEEVGFNSLEGEGRLAFLDGNECEFETAVIFKGNEMTGYLKTEKENITIKSGRKIA